MAKKSIPITNVDQGIHLANTMLDSDALEIPDCFVAIETLRGGLSEGVQTITVATPNSCVIILPTRGMNIWKAWAFDDARQADHDLAIAREKGGTFFGWKSPVRGPVHPSLVPVMSPDGLGWLEGFDELFVRCGLESNGAPEFDDTGKLKYPLHGRIGNRPASKVTIEVDSEQRTIRVEGEVDETRFHFQKLRLTSSCAISADSKTIGVRDEVRNLSAMPAEFQLLYHINFGEPLLEQNARIVAPVEKIVPRNDHAAVDINDWQRFPGPTPGAEEQVYFLHLHADEAGRSQVLLRNAESSAGACVAYNVNQLPALTIWKNPVAKDDGYVTGLEPGTNFPNPRSYEAEQGRVVRLDGGENWQTNLQIKMLTNQAEVTSVETQINDVAAGGQPEVFTEPQVGWCSEAKE